MKVYVDELPKSCLDCKLGWFYDCQYCILRPDLMEQDKWCEKEKHCQLQSLSDYTKQVRKEVVQEIKDKAELFGVCKTGTIAEEYHISKYILDQIQGETDAKD